MGDDHDFNTLLAFLGRIPVIESVIGHGRFDDGNWWVKFVIDITHPLSWHVVQELGCVLNYLSITERLPTVFMPVSPAPYMNGGPREFLSWIIQSSDAELKPHMCMERLEGRLPQPVEDISAWPTDDE
ncbi:MAG TPA: hypothetical protein VGB55_08055 [Tepidisphaeraceae bacterium]|jgi:hypothetical protein